MIAPDLARQQADVLAGATYDELRARCDAAHRALEAWTASYEAGLALAAQIVTTNGATPPLTVNEAATALACSRSLIYELLRAGKLRKLDGFDGITRIAHAEIVRFQAREEETA